MKASLIIAVYKDVEALSLIIRALQNQTYKNFEVVIAEDGNSSEMKNFISNIKNLNIIHTTQEDTGIRKCRSVNNGITASSGEYLIFIDGDCVPYSTFIESHIKLAENGYVLSGRRVNLGPKYSKKLRENKISPLKLEKSFLFKYPFIAKDCLEGHSEEGFRISPNGFIYKLFLKNRKSSKSLLGCNYSCFRKDMFVINGYDESLEGSAIGTDTDLEWRFKGIGLKLKSIKFIANIFHLYHKTNLNFYTTEKEAFELMKNHKNMKKHICDFGLNLHSNLKGNVQ
ncbi:Chondroitin synthase [Aliarcobacter thereius]|uniref:Chondroitin synthase n=1 Tax=Aliarcobacter thereius TaxID=544718 RepID=A0A1C0B506_9BACT|nr:glycosyltransferase [Aliarcobacter thereius]OCL97536.1 Chondroitin synthase [Aliarcobacter thereius]